MQKIVPFLWFNNNAEEALQFYSAIFPNARVSGASYYPKEVPGLGGMLMTAVLHIGEQQFMLLNGGPVYQFTPAISFFVSCADQQEVDWYWEKLLAGGVEMQCGWLTDKFGVTWQIVPEILGALLHNSDPEKSQRVMQAMLQMKKLDIATLENA